GLEAAAGPCGRILGSAAFPVPELLAIGEAENLPLAIAVHDQTILTVELDRQAAAREQAGAARARRAVLLEFPRHLSSGDVVRVELHLVADGRLGPRRNSRVASLPVEIGNLVAHRHERSVEAFPLQVAAALHRTV